MDAGALWLRRLGQGGADVPRHAAHAVWLSPVCTPAADLRAEPVLSIPAPGADVSKLEAAAAAGGKAAASKAVARSDSVLVVKNLPFSASEAELEALFGAVGEQRLCGWRGGVCPARFTWAVCSRACAVQCISLKRLHLPPALCSCCKHIALTSWRSFPLPCRPAGPAGAATHPHAGAG